MKTLQLLAGITLMAAGLPLLFYVTVLDMAKLDRSRWFDRPDLLTVVAVLLLLGGVLLVAT